MKSGLKVSQSRQFKFENGLKEVEISLLCVSTKKKKRIQMLKK